MPVKKITWKCPYDGTIHDDDDASEFVTCKVCGLTLKTEIFRDDTNPIEVAYKMDRESVR